MLFDKKSFVIIDKSASALSKDSGQTNLIENLFRV